MITNRMNFEELGDRFSSLMDPAQKVVKAMVSI